MTALLVVLTFVALAVAGALLFYVLRLSREDRERHEARSAALAGLIGGAPPDQAAPVRPADSRDPVPVFVERHESHVASDDAQPMFGEVQSRAHTGAPLLVAAGAAVVLLVLGGIYMFGRSGATAAAGRQPAPLELMSLNHDRSGEALRISGVVHNPGTGRSYADVVAVVFTFDRQGNFLSSGRAGLDLRQLPPGEESPFSITLPSAAGVTRYRVSFRTDESMIPHLDRRQELAARKQGTEP